MADFAKYAPKLTALEGGYCWHPEDQGGPTCCGITLSTFQQYYGKDKTILERGEAEPWECEIYALQM